MAKNATMLKDRMGIKLKELSWVTFGYTTCIATTSTNNNNNNNIPTNISTVPWQYKPQDNFKNNYLIFQA
jgi:hypothetical protein